MEKITLNTGTRMPIIGLGTWKAEPGKVGAAIEYAIENCGYEHLDCAAIYRNEPEIGQALQKIFSTAKIKRENIFITSKLWNDNHAKDKVLGACKKTLSDLHLDYLDLYLMHWGITDGGEKIPVRETWEAMEKLVKDGLVKAIGVANFTGPMIIDLLTYADIAPAVNQIELHPYNQQTKLVEFLHKEGIAVTAYSPLGSPANAKARGDMLALLEDPIINQLAQRYQKSPAQILIRWAIDRKTIVIPKSIRPENLKNNINVFDFKLSTEEMVEIAKLDKRHRFVDPWTWNGLPYFD